MPTTPKTSINLTATATATGVQLDLQDAASDHLAALLRGNIRSLSFADSVRDEALARLVESLPGAHHRATPETPQETGPSPSPGQPVSSTATPSKPAEQQDDVPYDTAFLADVLRDRLAAMRKGTDRLVARATIDSVSRALSAVPIIAMLVAAEADS